MIGITIDSFMESADWLDGILWLFVVLKIYVRRVSRVSHDKIAPHFPTIFFDREDV